MDIATRTVFAEAVRETATARRSNLPRLLLASPDQEGQALTPQKAPRPEAHGPPHLARERSGLDMWSALDLHAP